MTSRTGRVLAPLTALALALALAACASPAGGTRSASPTTSGSASGGSDEQTAVSLSVPVTVTSASGDPRVTAQITVAGGSPVTVLVDTGSTGLIIEQSAVGSDGVSTGNSLTQGYESGSVEAALTTGVVEIAGAQTPADFEFGVIADGSATNSLGGTQGILGIEPAALPNDPGHLASPLMALPAPLDQGMTVDVPSSGAGTITLGEPAALGEGATTVDLLQYSPSTSNPDGVALYRTAVNLCWTIASLARNCGPTLLDSGAPRTSFNTATVSGPQTESNGVLTPGQGVALATSTGDALWSFTTGTTKGVDMAVIENLGSNTDYNAAVGFYFTHVVAFDWAKGTASFTAQ